MSRSACDDSLNPAAARSMLEALTRVRPNEVRAAFGATFIVFVILLAHALLETARDALFLANLPATRLPWMYLVLAGVGLAVAGASLRVATRFGTRRAVVFGQLVAAAGTASLWALMSVPNSAVYYALYVWAGIASMSILVQFWLHLSEIFTATQAKRLFPVIGSGSILGVLVGYALADLIARQLGPPSLLLASAGFFLLGVPATLAVDQPGTPPANATDDSAPAETKSEPGLLDSISAALGHPYLRRVCLILLLASVTVTMVDFVFKSVVARSVAPENLAPFFARSYLVFNLLSLVALLAAATPLLRRVGVTGALAILPAALAVGGLGLSLVGGLAMALSLKGIDGALRWSTHKTAAELLFVPLPRQLRHSVKSVVDMTAQRGGQALGSLLILSVLSVTGDERVFGPLIVIGAGLWIYVALTARDAYLDLFRDSLSQGSVETRLDFPDLDIASLETLMAALNDSSDNKVIAAIDLLERKKKARLVPALILYHPSPPVLVRALDLFAATQRTDFLPIAKRLADHEYAEVRAAVLRAISAVEPDLDTLRLALEHHCPVVNVTAKVGLAVSGAKPTKEVVAELLRHADEDSALARPMIARAIRYQSSPEFAPVLLRLAHDPDLATRREAILAMRAARDKQFLPTLVDMLPDYPLRAEARRAILDFGETALRTLEETLADQATSYRVRVHLPRTISLFANQASADILLRHLLAEPRGLVRYKALRGLGRLVADNPALRLDRSTLDEVMHRTITSCYKALHWRALLEFGAAEQSERLTPAHKLLGQLLEDKKEHAQERLFRTIGLRFRREDVGQIYDGLRSTTPSIRSSSRELLESILPSRIADAVLTLTDDVPLAVQLNAGSSFYEPPVLDYEGLLAMFAADASPTLKAIATYHAAEVGIDLIAVRPSAEPAESAPLSQLQERAVEMLRREPSLPKEELGEA
jgi:AAA family ATP:ADP antiporter